MLTRLAYFGRETIISLRRNLLMTIAGVLTVAVSLALFGGIMLLSSWVDHGTNRIKGGVRLEAFMTVDATKQQISDVDTALKSDADVKSFTYIDKQPALAEFKKIFRKDPDLVRNITADALPPSFRIVPIRAERTNIIKSQFSSQPGIDQVATPDQALRGLLDATNTAKLIFIGLSLVLLTSSLFLIVNTIRLATFARRREIEVMRLVGASNWVVRVPHPFGPLVQGAIGAGLAFGFIWTLKVVISNVLNSQRTLFSTFRVTDSDAIGIGILIVIIGAVIGTLGSAIGLRRFLEG